MACASVRLVARGDMQSFHCMCRPRRSSRRRVECKVIGSVRVCEIDLGLLLFVIDHAFVRAELEENFYYHSRKDVAWLSGKIVKLNKGLYGLRKASREWYAMVRSAF